MKSRGRNILFAMVMMFVSVSFTLLVGEGVARLIVYPGDYLRPELSPDPILGQKVLPGSAGHDEWGFRNRHVPVSADIVAIGDSQTYGVSAKGSQSWPAQLARITGSDVYNLALGGYGPMEYDYLLRNQATRLNPKTIVVAVYFGNDFMDAFRTVYGRPGWEHLTTRRKDFVLDKGNAAQTAPPVLFAGTREWLVSNSVIYRMAAFSFGEFVHRLEVQHQAGTATKNFVVLSDQSGRLVTVFTPKTRLNALNTASDEVQEGIRLTADALVGMKDFADRKTIRFMVILLPTKESVYWPVVVRASAHPDEDLAQLVQQEASARAMLTERLEKSGICFEDMLPALRAKVDEEPLYPNNDDGHPNEHGYQVIAERVSQVLAIDQQCGGK